MTLQEPAATLQQQAGPHSTSPGRVPKAGARSEGGRGPGAGWTRLLAGGALLALIVAAGGGLATHDVGHSGTKAAWHRPEQRRLGQQGWPKAGAGPFPEVPAPAAVL